MMNRAVISAISGLAVVGGLLIAPPTWAAPPSNDSRANATTVTPPQTVTGTLVDATKETINDESSCGSTDASVWYRFSAPKNGAIIVQVDAAGTMDATVDLYRQVRSKLTVIDCAETNDAGVATLDDSNLIPGGDYVIRIGNRVGSVADQFSLRVLVPSPAPTPPGKKLPVKGAKGRVDRLVNSGDAYWTSMRQGVTMRLSMRVSPCARVDLYGPGTRDFDGDMLRSFSCGGYALFTPQESGRYFLVVWANKGRAQQRYHLRVAKAGRDDTAPGVFIRNNATVKGRVNGGIDSRDLYRFDVTRRSELRLWVTGSPELRLVGDDGRRYGRSSSFDRTVRPGRYFVAVEGAGKYTLHRISRTITTSRVSFNGQRSTTVSPGGAVRLGLRVTPAVTGRVVMVLERLDPFDGWQFVRRYRVAVNGGSAQATFTPAVGRYRLSGEYLGSRTAAKSSDWYARLRVQGPLVD